jgi:hypothetical protein
MWSLYGAPWLQQVAISGNCGVAGNGGNTPEPLPRITAACALRSMVRRGSGVYAAPAEATAKRKPTGGVSSEPAAAV